jgi:endonuclease YncB( thermonuclease family)
MTGLFQNRAMPLPWTDYERGVVDGDTIDLLLDLGHHQYAHHRARLARVDTAEVWGVSQDSDEFKRGVEHSRATVEWIRTAVDGHDGVWPLEIETRKSGKYGRLIAAVRRYSDDGILQDHLVDEYPEVNDGWR